MQNLHFHLPFQPTVVAKSDVGEGVTFVQYLLLMPIKVRLTHQNMQLQNTVFLYVL